MLNHEGLDVLIHPLTESSYDDHSKNALWIGTPVPMRLDILRPAYRPELLSGLNRRKERLLTPRCLSTHQRRKAAFAPVLAPARSGHGRHTASSTPMKAPTHESFGPARLRKLLCQPPSSMTGLDPKPSISWDIEVSKKRTLATGACR
jgi:Dopa 4,5-dioxygenase family